MKLEQYSVGSYFREAPEKRLEIIYDNYDNFPNVIIGFEEAVDCFGIGRGNSSKSDGSAGMPVRIVGRNQATYQKRTF